jgi:hypothetical protein
MSTTTTRPSTKPETDAETERIIRERMATFNEDVKTAVDAREALATIRKNLKPLPRQ